MYNEIYANLFILFLIVSFIIAYKLRDPSKDQEKQDAFIASITGGSLDKTSKP